MEYVHTCKCTYHSVPTMRLSLCKCPHPFLMIIWCGAVYYDYVQIGPPCKEQLHFLTLNSKCPWVRTQETPVPGYSYEYSVDCMVVISYMAYLYSIGGRSRMFKWSFHCPQLVWLRGNVGVQNTHFLWVWGLPPRKMQANTKAAHIDC